MDRLAVEGDDGLLAALQSALMRPGLATGADGRRDLASVFISKELALLMLLCLIRLAGARERAAALAASMVQKIVYVSCNPATLPATRGRW